ncbi:pseudouridine synthase [Radiomyces spectabilis]|uniref:pseudouridine synthase n=1 Tax=Radiomyces spectabilis TaxID=64574 RepID=UPI00221E7A13|nr:pseudouridine synthase [Radiomyces spectabilis]KAI8376455.1 pseudouridine synthase [Radiomyces spectabilis]
MSAVPAAVEKLDTSSSKESVPKESPPKESPRNESPAARKKTSRQRKEHFQSTCTRKSAEDNGAEPVPFEPIVEPRLPKKKVALLLGFNGTGFQGMQINPTARSIESEVFEALCKAGAVSQNNAVDPKKVQLMRAARTDKGVHAAGNIISLKMIVEDPDIVKKVNSHLSEQIRVWGFVETQRSFHAKNMCDSRVYEYLLPTYAFMKPAKKEYYTAPTSETDLRITSNVNDEVRYVALSTKEEMAEKYTYRISPENLDNFRKAMACFQGTHNFHNYTIGQSYTDKSSNRYMISIQVDDPFCIHGMEWLSIKLHGQSFMLHQIRKMISMALLTVRSETPLSIIPKTFASAKVNIPKAPALGLLLERPIFTVYNRKVEEKGERQQIDFDVYKDTIDDFKKRWIYDKIFENEKAEQV